jgi:hypothetical protein
MSDFDSMREWYKGYGMNIRPNENVFFPKTGYVVEGVAAGFLYIVMGAPLGYLDGYIANRKASKSDRNQALDLITEMLLALAKVKRIRYLKCDTQVDPIRERAKRFGFTSLGEYTVLTRGV